MNVEGYTSTRVWEYVIDGSSTAMIERDVRGLGRLDDITHTHTHRQMDTRTTQGDDFPRERRKCIATVASCTTYSLRPYSVHMYLLTIQYICSTAPWTRTVISPVVSPAIIAIMILSQSAILCGRPIGLELIARVSERPDRRLQETVKDVSVCNVHTAH